jgi:hypothetical protein
MLKRSEPEAIGSGFHESFRQCCGRMTSSSTPLRLIKCGEQKDEESQKRTIKTPGN